MAKKLYKVWNRGSARIDCDIAGDHYVIEPNGFVEVKRRQAVAIKGHRPQNNAPWQIEVEKFGVDLDAKGFTCNVCLAVFPNIGDLNEHLKTHEDRFRDYDKGKKDLKEKEEKEEKRKVFSCPICILNGTRYTTEKASSFKKHLLSHEGVEIKQVEEIIKSYG